MIIYSLSFFFNEEVRNITTSYNVNIAYHLYNFAEYFGQHFSNRSKQPIRFANRYNTSHLIIDNFYPQKSSSPTRAFGKIPVCCAISGIYRLNFENSRSKFSKKPYTTPAAFYHHHCTRQRVSKFHYMRFNFPVLYFDIHSSSSLSRGLIFVNR